jgi:Cys-tRNA(Pro)/Cys-tRNA(Cys) deacylase
MARTRAIEFLEKAGVNFEVREFHATDFTAEEAAEKLHLPLEDVYKTLLTRAEESGPVVVIVPGHRELNLKKLAELLNEKHVEMAKLSDLQRLTGYLKGGCSPLAQRRSYPTFLEEEALTRARISISAGLRGLQILISPQDLVRVSGARVAALCG